MKVTVIIATLMVAQVSGSFLGVFQGAVLSVQNSYGKLFNDVVTDVKDTFDCTILAVEHIFYLSEDASDRYNKKCASAKNDTQSDFQLKNNMPVSEISIANDEEYLKNELLVEIDARINATLLKFVNGYNPHDKLEAVQKELAKETERLADISNLVRQELGKLSKEIDFTSVERKGYKPSVHSILDELKVLETIEQNLQNYSHANEIQRLVDDVLNKLHVIESSRAKRSEELDGILRDLERSSNRSYKDMRQQLEDLKAEEVRHLNVIKAKMDEREKLPKYLEYAKVDNTFATIERPKIYLVPIEEEIASKTVLLSSKHTVESIPPNVVTNTDNKFLTSITKQISSSPKIAIQTSRDGASSVQINDASGVITPVSISTSSFVNENNVDVMETLMPRKSNAYPTTTLMPTLELLKTSLEPIRSPTRTQLENAINSSLMTSENYTIEGRIPEELKSSPERNTEPNVSSETMQSKPARNISIQPKSTTDLSLTAPETNKSLNGTPKPNTYHSMMPTERDTNPKTPPEPTWDLPVTTTEPATSSAVNPRPTRNLLVTTSESTKNPGTNPELSMDLQVTVGGGIINSLMVSKSSTNSRVMDAAATIRPSITQDPNTSLPVSASRLISFATTPEPTKNPPMTNLTPTLELAMHLPLEAPESNFGTISEHFTEFPVSPAETSEPIPNMLTINSDATMRTTTTPEPIMSLPVTTSESKSSLTTPKRTTNFPFTALESTISSATIREHTTKSLPSTTTEATKYHLVQTTGIRTSIHGTITESTSSSPNIIPEATTVREPTYHIEPNHSLRNTKLSVSACEINTSSIITPEPTTNMPVSTSQEPKLSSHLMSPESSISYTLTILEPTPASGMTTLGPTMNSQMEVLQPQPSKILRETTTSRSIVTSESTTSSTEKTSGSLETNLKLVTNNLSNLQHPFNLPINRPEVAIPSVNAFLNYIDRKEGFTRPIIQSTGTTTTPHTASISYSKPLSGPINAKLNDFFSHLPPQNISAYARSDYAVPMNRTVPGVIRQITPKIGGSEAHSRALKEAKKLIKDSKRAHRIINNIFNKKNKGKRFNKKNKGERKEKK